MSQPGQSEWAERAAAILYARGARRVWAWGSLGEGHRLDLHSDIDLAVEGMTGRQVEAVKAELCRRLPHKVDVISMEETDGQVRWFVARGRKLPRNVAGRMANPRRPTLRAKRLAAVAAALDGAERVLDLGCGPGDLIAVLAGEPGVAAITGVDKEEEALRAARRRLRSRLTREQLQRVTLSHGLFTWRDPAFAGHDAAVAMEVIEHLPPAQLATLEAVVLGFVRPARFVLTTPNAEYNRLFGLAAGERRHADHRFEWTRDEFEAWGAAAAARHGYAFETAPVGGEHPEHGPATQLGRFDRRGPR